MKKLGFVTFLFLSLAACSSKQFKDGAKNTGKAYCEQQCFNNSLTAMEQFDCKRRCNEQP
jgi:hypothetical protein